MIRMTQDMTHDAFSPDWCIAPAATLTDWLEENGVTADELAVACVGAEHKDMALRRIQRVLQRQPLDDISAEILARGTGASAILWRNLEHNYRAGLAAGLKET
jgi:hypothetical protein